MIACDHVTVLRQEAVSALVQSPQGIYIDATFGRGGHSRAILNQLSTDQGRLFAIDADPEAQHAAQAFAADQRFSFVAGQFGAISELLRGKLPAGQAHGILLDLGVSSPQLDQAHRGFSFMRNGPLDMRFNSNSNQPSAAQWLATVTETQLAEVIKQYGEDRYAQRIAKAIVNARSKQSIEYTKQLAEIVVHAVPKTGQNTHPATRTFQAIRMCVNQELEELSRTLEAAAKLILHGGRLVVIAFHSLEDRLVKQCIKPKQTLAPKLIPLYASEKQHAPWRAVGKPLRASAAEIKANPRSRSAIMRIAERVEV